MGPIDREVSYEVIVGTGIAKPVSLPQDPSNDAVQETARTLASPPLGQLDAFVHCRIVRNPIEEENLVEG
jgi:hypothetical protein